MSKGKPKPRKVSAEKAAVEVVRDALHEQCKAMSPDQFRRVLEELQGDIEGHLTALQEEES